MSKLKKSLVAKTDARANDAQIYFTDKLRITILTPLLIRVEKSDNFTDLASQSVWFRRFECEKATVNETGNTVKFETSQAVFTIKGNKPVSVFLKSSKKKLFFSKQKNLKGTYRTLDGTFGKIPLDDGLITKEGAYLYDDSKTLLLDEGGHFIKRNGKQKDFYAFAYGRNYRETIKAFYKISSSTPLVPRFALGVWWSRYHAYTQSEYLELMDKFEKRNIPLTVATIDMDWHWVKDIDKKFNVKYGGWTGYSWNKELFPDYKDFLKKLKEKNLHITLNLHPADGVHTYEDMYEDFAKAVGDSSKKDLPFKCSNDDYWNAYFDILHKPYEKDGVDFWWIDWQQGKKSDADGLDPLNALNHYHFLDNAQNGELPLILSRYAGFGSHRYPLGFSGDTAISWKVFDFQPYFTINATNSAYTWWSHDIGGHHFGKRDDELYLRWIQFGVFSPILRLHSTASQLLGKEPWKYRRDICENAQKWLRLRHRLIPYIYTMDYRTHKDGVALCEPMYYSYPNDENSFKCKNQYMFGSELIVCPITKKADKETNFGSVKAWIPDGTYTDIFTLQKYKGNQIITLNRELYDIPVLAKEGAIIPLSNDGKNSCANPRELEVLVFKGNNTFTLYEDNGKTDYESDNVKTVFENILTENEITLSVKAPVGDISLIPEKRTYKIIFRDTVSNNVILPENAQISTSDLGEVEVTLPFSNTDAVIKIKDFSCVETLSSEEKIIDIFSRWQVSTSKKNHTYKPFDKKKSKSKIMSAMKKAHIPQSVKLLIEEAVKQL